jgi:hypothetical protein
MCRNASQGGHDNSSVKSGCPALTELSDLQTQSCWCQMRAGHSIHVVARLRLP